MKKVNELIGEPLNGAERVASEQTALVVGIKESDTGLAAPSLWDIVSDKQMMGVRLDESTRSLRAS